MTIKVYKEKIPKKYFKLLPTVFWERMSEACDPFNFCLGFFEGHKFLGAAKVLYYEPILVDDLPLWDLEIESFEVNYKERRKGYGRRMYEYLETRFPIYKVNLMYYDDDAKLFWKRMGFRVTEGTHMEKKIKNNR